MSENQGKNQLGSTTLKDTVGEIMLLLSEYNKHHFIGRLVRRL